MPVSGTLCERLDGRNSSSEACVAPDEDEVAMFSVRMANKNIFECLSRTNL